MSRRQEAFEKLEEPQERGDATEAIIRAELVSRGVPVLVPESDNQPYDLVVDADGTFHRLQCKTAYGNEEGVVQFETRKTRVKSYGYERDDYVGEIEFFAVYNPRLDEIYLIPIEQAPKTTMKIRFVDTANRQQKNVNWNENFLLDEQLDSLSS